MQQHFKRYAVLGVALLATAALAGCGSLSRDVAPDGSHAAKLVWPNPADTHGPHEGGIRPKLDKLRQVKVGLDKKQITLLIGTPHFHEGFMDVHEWDYLFHIRGADGKDNQCLYKILFDRHMLARSFYWKPESCADLLNPPPPKKPEVVKDETFTLSADALFAFNKGDVKDIKQAGLSELDTLAGKLKDKDRHADRITVIGYTDRIGSDAYNQKLSEQRANAVRDYLVSKGVPADHISAVGKGEADPVATCHDASRAKLIACLAPNRRVVVKAEATKPAAKPTTKPEAKPTTKPEAKQAAKPTTKPEAKH